MLTVHLAHKTDCRQRLCTMNANYETSKNQKEEIKYENEHKRRKKSENKKRISNKIERVHANQIWISMN